MHCVVMAAGFGRRFGGDKLNFPVEGKPMYRHIYDRLQALAREQICDVTLVSRPGALWDCPPGAVLYEGAEEGVSATIRAGLKALPQDGEPVAFFVADQPFLSLGTIRAFLAAYAVCGKGILSAAHGERLGNPVAFARRYEAELMRLTGEMGGKTVLRNHREDTALFQIDAEKELMDLDVSFGENR
jgi:CTP:molybdopterin cytidylyltransferase MocA